MAEIVWSSRRPRYIVQKRELTYIPDMAGGGEVAETEPSVVGGYHELGHAVERAHSEQRLYPDCVYDIIDLGETE